VHCAERCFLLQIFIIIKNDFKKSLKVSAKQNEEMLLW